MYEDIVASTQPLNYNPAIFLQKFNYAGSAAASGGYFSRGSSIPGFMDAEEDDIASVIEPGDYE
jgi:hypothetical protein